MTQIKELLTVQDMDKALIVAIKICQANEFHQELHSLRTQKLLNSKSKILNLHPFIDSNGIIRVRGRLRHAPIEYSKKHPILLLSKHHITELIIRDAYYLYASSGTSSGITIIAYLRQKRDSVCAKEMFSLFPNKTTNNRAINGRFTISSSHTSARIY